MQWRALHPCPSPLQWTAGMRSEMTAEPLSVLARPSQCPRYTEEHNSCKPAPVCLWTEAGSRPEAVPRFLQEINKLLYWVREALGIIQKVFSIDWGAGPCSQGFPSRGKKKEIKAYKWLNILITICCQPFIIMPMSTILWTDHHQVTDGKQLQKGPRTPARRGRGRSQSLVRPDSKLHALHPPHPPCLISVTHRGSRGHPRWRSWAHTRGQDRCISTTGSPQRSEEGQWVGWEIYKHLFLFL